MICAECRFQPWPCVSCGAPRCACRDADTLLYRHYYPTKAQEIVLEPTKKFDCGHYKEPWNMLLRQGKWWRCRTCYNDYMRDWHRHISAAKARAVSGEQLARDYLEGL